MASRTQLTSVLAATTTLLTLAACSGGDRPRTRTERPQAGVSSNAAAFTKPVLEAPTELMQKSVARVLGFTDVGDIALTIYQDTESALYESLAAQASRPDGVAPDPLFYHSPVFIAGSPKLLVLSSGDLNVTIPNAFTQQAVRQVIGDNMAEVLRVYKIAVEKVRILPMEDISAEVNAFGKKYKVDAIDDQFRTIVFNIPSQDIPASVIEAIKTAQENQKGQIFLDNLSLVTIQFNYFVQQYGSQECRLNVSDNDIRNMFMDQTGCPALPTTEQMTAGIAKIAEKRSPSAAQSTQQKLDTLLAAGNTVTTCLAGKEAAKLQAAASVSCTKGGTRPEDQSKDNQYSPQVAEFLNKAILPQMEKKIAGADMSKWDDDVSAAVVRMFGDPERFAQTISNINSQISRNETLQKDDDYYDQFDKFLWTLKNHDVLNTKSRAKDKQSRETDFESSERGRSSSGSGGFGIGIGPVSLGINGGSGNSSFRSSEQAKDEFKRKVDEFHTLGRELNQAQGIDKESKLKKVSNFLFENGIDVGLEEIDGEFKVFPRLNIAVSTNVDRLNEFAQSFRTNDLGFIVEETENIPVQLTSSEPAELVVNIQCNAMLQAFVKISFPLTQFQWWNSPKFWTELSKTLSARVATSQCNFLGVKMFYRNAEDNPAMVPKVLDLTVQGIIRAGTPDSLERSLPIPVELRRENTEATPVDGAISVNAGSKQFNEITIAK